MAWSHEDLIFMTCSHKSYVLYLIIKYLEFNHYKDCIIMTCSHKK